MPADGRHSNGTESQTQDLILKFSTGRGITKANNLTPLEVDSIHALEQLVYLHATPITSLINPSHGVRKREHYDQLPENIRKQIKQSGTYFTSGCTTTGGRQLGDMDLVGLALLDIDKGNLTLGELQAHLDPWQFIAWESISSRTGQRKWRVALLLDYNIPAGSYRLCYERWSKELPERVADHVDLSQGRPTQPALCPVLWEGQETLIYKHEEGERLRLSKYLTAEEKLLDPTQAAFENYSPPIERLADERIRNILKLLDPDPEDTWIRVGWALHHQFGGDTKGLDLWKEWAAGSPKFDANTHDYKWLRMIDRPTRSLTTWHSIERLAREAAGKVALTYWAQVIAKIENADDLKLSVADGIIADKKLSAEDRKQLGTVLKKKAGELGDKHWSVAKWRQHITLRVMVEDLPVSNKLEHNEVTAEPTESEVLPDNPTIPKAQSLRHWRNQWAYLMKPKGFLEIETGMVYLPEAVNAKLDRYLLNDKGRPTMPASQFLNNILRVRTYANVGYFPGKGAEVTLDDGSLWYNSWRESDLPVGWYTQQEKQQGLQLTQRQRVAIFRFLRQVCYLLEPDDRRYFIRWLAWCVQNEGVKARWSPLIYSVQGTGKTLLATAIGEIFGTTNWSLVDGHEVISSDFTGWAENKVFCVLEELKVMGAGRGGFAVSNKLKPFMSNDFIRINEKFQPAKTVPNVVNYIALTNHYHPISVESASERRWFMCASPLRHTMNRGTFNFMQRRDGGRYFFRLAELSKDAEMILGLRRWLWHMDLRGWTAQGNAPKTPWLRDVAEASNAGTAHGVLPDLLARDWTGNDLNLGWFSLTCLRDHIRQQGYDGNLDPDKVLGRTSTLVSALNEQGYHKFDRIKIDTVWHAIYIHSGAYTSGGWVSMLQRNYTKGEWKKKVKHKVLRAYRAQIGTAGTQGAQGAQSDFK
jgi:hypothetical protein